MQTNNSRIIFAFAESAYNTLVEIDDGDNGSMYVYVTPEEYHRITY